GEESLPPSARAGAEPSRVRDRDRLRLACHQPPPLHDGSGTPPFLTGVVAVDAPPPYRRSCGSRRRREALRLTADDHRRLRQSGVRRAPHSRRARGPAVYVRETVGQRSSTAPTAWCVRTAER